MTFDAAWNGLIGLLNAAGGGMGVAALITAFVALVKALRAGKTAQAAQIAIEQLEASAAANASANVSASQSVVNNTWHAQNLYVNVPVEEVTKPAATSAGLEASTGSLDWKPGELVETLKPAEAPLESGPKTPSDST